MAPTSSLDKSPYRQCKSVLTPCLGKLTIKTEQNEYEIASTTQRSSNLNPYIPNFSTLKQEEYFGSSQNYIFKKTTQK